MALVFDEEGSDYEERVDHVSSIVRISPDCMGGCLACKVHRQRLIRMRWSTFAKAEQANKKILWIKVKAKISLDAEG